MPLKRTLSSISTRLTARVSSAHPSVTLLEITDASPPRHAKRTRSQSDADGLADIEAIIEDASAPEPTASRSKRGAATARSGTETGRPVAVKSRSSEKSPRKIKPIAQSLKVPHPAPPKWRETYSIIKDMRSRIVAPVDSMGCEQAQHLENDPKVRPRLATLIKLNIRYVYFRAKGSRLLCLSCCPRRQKTK